MIIGKALGDELFDGMTLDVKGKEVGVNYTYNDQDALIKFISECDKNSIKKFPLIFYVTGKIQDNEKGTLKCKTQLILITNTNPNLLPKKRTLETFKDVLQPLYNKVKKAINSSKNFTAEGSIGERYSFTDKTNYGVVDNAIGKKVSEKSGITDYIDARIIDIDIKYKQSCDKDIIAYK